MAKWEEKRLSSVFEIISGGTPKTEIEEYWNGTIPWLSVKDFSGDNKHVKHTEKMITEKGLQNSAAKILSTKDIIISARGTVGEIAQIIEPMAFNQSCYGLRAKQNYYPDFLFYALKYHLRIIKAVANGAVFDTIVLDTFDRIKLIVPDLSTQERIADILSAYDDLIENNNRRIELLEKAAQDLYKEWFVRFRFLNHENTKFVNGLPEGWEVKKLHQISDFVYGKMPQKNKECEKGFPIFSGYRVKGFYEEYMFADSMLILIARGVGGTGNIKLSPPKSYITNLSIIFKLKDENLKRYLFLLFSFNNLRYLDTGAAQSQITIENLKNVKVIIPKASLIRAFNQLSKSIYMEIELLQEQNQNLKKQRDLLLPRLMSGKLEV